MKYLTLLILIITLSCTKKDKCYVCKVENKSQRFGIVKQTVEHCGSKQSLKDFMDYNTTKPFLVDIDSNGNRVYNSRTINCK